jgi:hypothetical protein
MVHRNTSKRSKVRPYFDCPIWSSRRLPSFIRSGLLARKNPSVMPSTNSSAGIAPNLVWPLTELSSFATDFFSNRKIWHLQQSTFAWPPCGDWRTRQPIPVC